MNLSIKRIISLFFIVAGIGAVYYFNLSQYMNLNWIHEHKNYLLCMVNEYYWYSVLVYICFYIIATACALPGTFIMTMLGGYLFNVFPGVLYINIGATLGAAAAFLAARYLVGVWVQRTYQTQLRAVNQQIKEYGNYYFLLARLIVVLPFFLVNLVSGLTRVPLSTFMWTTAVGIIPATLVYAYAGRQLMYIHSPYDLFTWQVILAFILFTLLLLVPLLVRSIRSR